MRVTTVFAAVAACAFLVACNEEASCTQEQAQEKMTQLMTKIQEVGATNPEKLAALGPKAQELAEQARNQTADSDLGPACKAIDEMIAELNK